MNKKFKYTKEQCLEDIRAAFEFETEKPGLGGQPNILQRLMAATGLNKARNEQPSRQPNTVQRRLNAQ